MKNLTASLRQISDAIKKTIHIVDEAGCIVYSSDKDDLGHRIDGFKKSSCICLSKEPALYIFADDLSFEEKSLISLILKDKITEGTADNYQQFLVNILDGHKYDDKCCSTFNIPYSKSYIVYCLSMIESEQIDDICNILRNSFYESKYLWVLQFHDDIILIEAADNFTDEIKLKAKTAKDMVNSELYTNVCIGVGNIHNGISNISKSYKEAVEAVNIGRVFSSPENIYIYKDILSERVISLLTQEQLRALFDEISLKNFDKVFDDETIRTIQVMFKNNLNISDSSKALFIHRNTLLYRIEKLQKFTGFDIKKFEDAVTLKLYLIIKSISSNI